MELRTTSVSKCLDKKLLVAGYEIPDLLVIFTLLSVLNFVFGRTHLKLALVWLPTILLAAVIRLGKRGKPDNYLLHFTKFRLNPRYLHAFPEPTVLEPPPRLKRITA